MTAVELDAMINDWPAEWRELVSVTEILIGPPTNAPVEPVRKDDQQSDEESSTETPTDLEVQSILKKLRMKRYMDQAMNSSTRSAMEVQLNWLVKVVNDATDAAAKEMKKSAQEGFTEVKNQTKFCI